MCVLCARVHGYHLGSRGLLLELSKNGWKYNAVLWRLYKLSTTTKKCGNIVQYFMDSVLSMIRKKQKN